MYKLIREKNCTTIRPDESTIITNYITKSANPNLSIVIAEINGDHGEYIYHGGIQFFLVIGGEVEFIFEDISVKLFEGDCIQIYNEWHRKIGYKAKIVIVSYPAFEHSLEEIR